MYCYCLSAWIFGNLRTLYVLLSFSAWIFGNSCELRILYVLLLLFGLDIWKSKDLICIVIVFRLGYLETHAN